MGARKKFQGYKPDKDTSSTNNLEDKKLVEAYIKKIGQALQKDPALQKKAALIIEQMIKGSKQQK